MDSRSRQLVPHSVPGGGEGGVHATLEKGVGETEPQGGPEGGRTWAEEAPDGSRNSLRAAGWQGGRGAFLEGWKPAQHCGKSTELGSRRGGCEPLDSE